MGKTKPLFSLENTSKTNMGKLNVDVYTDGACRGNPGVASCAFIFVKNNIIFYKRSYFVSEYATNNIAEYAAVINALKTAISAGYRDVNLFSDSQLVIYQIIGKYGVNNPTLRELNQKVQLLKPEFDVARFTHVRRNNKYISICDRLCNDVLDLRQTEVG